MCKKGLNGSGGGVDSSLKVDITETDTPMSENDGIGMSGSSEGEKREGAGLDMVSGELYSRFCAARDSRRSGGVEKEMIEDMRRRDGEYEPSVLAALEAQGGSKAFDNVTDVK